MFFECKTILANSEFTPARVRMYAYENLAGHKLTNQERILDKYLQKKFGYGLIAACMYVCANATYQRNFDGSIVIILKNKTINELAKLITFGNGVVLGTQLLKQVFQQ